MRRPRREADGLSKWNGRAVLPEHPPFVVSWESLPQRVIQVPPRSQRLVRSRRFPRWLNTGDPERPFDFSLHVRRLCEDIVQKCLVFRHIQIDRLLFTVTRARTRKPSGLLAHVTPMRFEGGTATTLFRGRQYQVQRYRCNGVEFLYVMTFCLPRFQDQSFDDKLVTLFHELYHIGPAFDGDLRRHRGRYCFHSSSRKRYNAHMEELVRDYLNSNPELPRLDFLRLDFEDLQQRHGSVVGVAVPRPKMLPLPKRRKTG